MFLFEFVCRIFCLFTNNWSPWEIQQSKRNKINKTLDRQSTIEQIGSEFLLFSMETLFFFIIVAPAANSSYYRIHLFNVTNLK